MARNTEKADIIDKNIGNIIRRKREILGMTQGDLASITGVTYQQIHKYEKGVNRISAGRLALIADGLSIHVAEFFKEPATSEPSKTVEINGNFASKFDSDFEYYFNYIEEPRQKEALYLLVRAIAEKVAK